MLPTSLIDRLRYIEIVTTRVVRDHRAGDYLSRQRGHSFVFDEHRPYQRGDDTRQIDWNVTARMRMPFVKRQLEEKELGALILVDMSRSMLFTSTGQTRRELAIEVAALLAFSGAADNMSVGLLAFTDRVERYFPAKRGKAQAWHLIEALCEIQPAGTRTDFAPAIEELSSRLRSTALVFCISDFASPGTLWRSPSLKRVLHKADFVPVVLEDPWEEDMADVRGFLRLRDAEDRAETVLDLSSRPRQELQLHLGRRRNELHRHFYELGLDHLTLRTAEDHVQAIMRFFTARARKR